jgi:tetratricopeptide (TPR) repeat protein
VATALTLVLLGNSALCLWAGEEKLQKLLHEVNSTTGKTVVDARIKELSKSPDAKSLIQHAHGELKKDRKALNYNGAYILAEVARIKKDIVASEAFYRVCTKEAAELESTQKLLESYGGLIELLYDGKKYKESEKVCREVLELQTGPGKPRTVITYISPVPGAPLTVIPLPNYDSAKPLHGPVERLLIQSVAKQGKVDEALQMAQKLSTQKNPLLARDVQAWVLREAGKTDEAIKLYEAILSSVINDNKMDAEDRAKYEARYRYILSNLYTETKQIAKGIEQLRILVKNNPDEPGYLNDLGFIMADHDMNLPEAEQLVQKALELDRKKRKNDPEAEDRDKGAYLDSMGWVLFKQKKYKEAKEYLLKAIQDEDSQHIEIFDHLGDTLLALGEREAAVKYWQKGLQIAGDSKRDQDRVTQVMEKIKKNSK